MDYRLRRRRPGLLSNANSGSADVHLEEDVV